MNINPRNIKPDAGATGGYRGRTTVSSGPIDPRVTDIVQIGPDGLPTDSKHRKEYPMARGLVDYFPQALAEVSHVSHVGNQQHNPGEELHWDRSKSTDHADCIMRHLMARGTRDTDGVRHSAKLAWRALANLQIEIEGGCGAMTFKHKDADDALRAVQTASRTPVPVSDAKPLEVMDIEGMKVQRIDHNGTPALMAIQPRPTLPRAAYIAGPMRGIKDYNFPAFDECRNRLLRLGWIVISPADLDRLNDVHEDTPESDVNTYEQVRAFFARDTKALLSLRAENHDAIVLLPGWGNSTGVGAELPDALWLGLDVLDSVTMRPFETERIKSAANKETVDLPVVTADLRTHQFAFDRRFGAAAVGSRPAC